MFYVDSLKTTTRRDSSLITTPRNSPDGSGVATARAQSSAHIGSESGNSIGTRPKGSVQRELVTLLFESMITHIVESWDVIAQDKPEITEIEKTVSEVTVSTKKKGKETATKSAKNKVNWSKDMSVSSPIATVITWWSGPDERAVIRFKNGNLYEGNISMKCMHGEGRFQWADGTVYLGQFRNNEMFGKGTIQWKDDTWYEGDFRGNLRHGRGLYVDSRKQAAYVGGWHLGTKHGRGVIYYSRDFSNSYDGEWVNNVRTGLGSREYCHNSGYKGEWDTYTREGKGLMIWPNHDFYTGDWKNNVMSGFGIYIWDMYYNHSMSLPAINIYRGEWLMGKRNGFGVLNLGVGLGAHYKGEFKNNMKHGVGKIVTNNGEIFRHKALFIDDNLGPCESQSECVQSARAPTPKLPQIQEPIQFEICDARRGLIYHVEQALSNIDKRAEVRAAIINEFIEKNKYLEFNVNTNRRKEETSEEESLNIEDLVSFEESSLYKALRCYETELRNIYYKYATICNTDEISFTPILIRLYLWQLYFDCNIHEKGLTLVQIDNLFCKNPEWNAITPHNPFEKIAYWQYLHSLITVASKLYAKKQLPGPKPDTIMASAFRTFMEKDVLPGSSRHKGYLVSGYGVYCPLKGLYVLYHSIGEPHTIRAFLRAALLPHHVRDLQPPMVDAPDCCLPVGHNAYVFGDEMSFTVEERVEKCPILDSNGGAPQPQLKLFNFGNLSCRKIINIFSKIFPQVVGQKKVLDLDVEITFYEFFEAFMACTENSISIQDEELTAATQDDMTNSKKYHKP